jgi:hypothetical protein
MTWPNGGAGKALFSEKQSLHDRFIRQAEK